MAQIGSETGQERLTVGGTEYRIGDEIAATPEALLALAATQLIIARRTTVSGEILTVLKPRVVDPSVSGMSLAEYLAAAQQQDTGSELRAASSVPRQFKPRERMPVPPTVGYVSLPDDIPDYFYVRNPDTLTIGAIPYEAVQQTNPGGLGYRLNLAEAVE